METDQGMHINFKFIDMGGQEQFEFLVPMYMKMGNQGLYYFIDSRRIDRSMKHYEANREIINKYFTPDKIFFVATKYETEDYPELAEKIDGLEQVLNHEIYRISSKTGAGVDLLKNKMVTNGVKNYMPNGKIILSYFLTGLGGGGKSTLIKRLITGNFVPCELTVGPEFQVYSCDINYKLNGQNISVTVL